MARQGFLHPLWHDTVGPGRAAYPVLDSEVDCDVAVIGGGITGLTTAWHLLNAGLRVVVLEASEIGRGTTGSSTGNLYAPVGPRLHAIEAKHGNDALLSVVSARTEAVNFIEARARELQVDCEFQRVPFHLFSAPDEQALQDVRKELAAAQHAGLQVSAEIPVSFPFRATALTTVFNQAQFNPLRYCEGLAAALAAKGCSIFENSRALDTEDGTPCIVMTAAGRVRARHIVKATHVPQGFYAVHAAMLPHREYAVLARVEGDRLPPGIYWNASSAWHYSVRPWKSDKGNFIMALGEPHKPGEQDAAQLERLTQFLRSHFNVQEIAYTWAAQNYKPADLLPYIGTSPLERHTWMATGFAADGLVWGTLAGKLISEGIRELADPAADLFSPKRFTPVASAKNFLKENAAVVKHLAHDVTVYGRSKECSELAPGAGAVITMDGEKVAACRDRDGALHIVGAHCTHLGCLVHWNPLEQSWDCPCHGSRFDMDGRVLEGPAQRDLARHQ